MILHPKFVSFGDFNAPMWAAGGPEAFPRCKIAFLCSSQCPGSVILRTFDIIADWRDEGRVVAGGFHSPIEQECFDILLRGRQLVIWMPARSITGMHLKSQLGPAFADGRLLILSPFDPKQRRITADVAVYRNQILARMAEAVFVAHAAPGSRTLKLCEKLSEENRILLTIDDPANHPLLDLGAKPISLRASPDGVS